MIAADEDALICDLAETYGIFNMEGLPVELVAVLSCGLRDNSRIKMIMADMTVDPETLLSAATVDRLTTLIWQRTKDGSKGRNRPPSIVERMLKTKEDDGVKRFRSVEEFERERKRILGEIENG